MALKFGKEEVAATTPAMVAVIDRSKEMDNLLQIKQVTTAIVQQKYDEMISEQSKKATEYERDLLKVTVKEMQLENARSTQYSELALKNVEDLNNITIDQLKVILNATEQSVARLKSSNEDLKKTMDSQVAKMGLIAEKAIADMRKKTEEEILRLTHNFKVSMDAVTKEHQDLAEKAKEREQSMLKFTWARIILTVGSFFVLMHLAMGVYQINSIFDRGWLKIMTPYKILESTIHNM